MQILKTWLIIDDAYHAIIDTIEYEGKFWLMPTWFQVPGTRFARPERLVLLDSLQPQGSALSTAMPHFVVRRSIPKAVLYGDVPPELTDIYTVIYPPDLIFELPTDEPPDRLH